MPMEASQRRRADSPEIPDKLYFRIGEVARLCDLPAYVLRFWESEFPQLKPNKSGTGQRLYRRRDVEMVVRIKRLLYDEGYTIAGARHVFQVEKSEKRAGNNQTELPIPDTSDKAATTGLEKVRVELREILLMLSSTGTRAKDRKPRNSHTVAPRPSLFE